MAKEALKEARAARADENKAQAVKEEAAKEPASKNGRKASQDPVCAVGGPVTEVKEPASGSGRKVAQDPIYSAGELAAGAKEIFHTRPECVVAALRAAGKEKCTVCEAKEIVEKFLKRAVQ